ncbi:hypothetical protein P9112_004002 [Eukaryota sp. TZLM1-RC]
MDDLLCAESSFIHDYGRSHPFLYCGPALIAIPSPLFNDFISPLCFHALLDSNFINSPGFLHIAESKLLSPHPFSLISHAVSQYNPSNIHIVFAGSYSPSMSNLFFSSLSFFHSKLKFEPQPILSPLLRVLHSMCMSPKYGFVGKISVKCTPSNHYTMVEADFPHLIIPITALLREVEFFSIFASLSCSQLRLLGINGVENTKLESELGSLHISATSKTCLFNDLLLLVKAVPKYFLCKLRRLLNGIYLLINVVHSTECSNLSQILKEFLPSNNLNANQKDILIALGKEISSILSSLICVLFPIQRFQSVNSNRTNQLVSFDLLPNPNEGCPSIIKTLIHLEFLIPFKQYFTKCLTKMMNLYFQSNVNINNSSICEHSVSFSEFAQSLITLIRPFVMEGAINDLGYLSYLAHSLSKKQNIVDYVKQNLNGFDIDVSSLLSQILLFYSPNNYCSSPIVSRNNDSFKFYDTVSNLCYLIQFVHAFKNQITQIKSHNFCYDSLSINPVTFTETLNYSFLPRNFFQTQSEIIFKKFSFSPFLKENSSMVLGNCELIINQANGLTPFGLQSFVRKFSGFWSKLDPQEFELAKNQDMLLPSLVCSLLFSCKISVFLVSRHYVLLSEGSYSFLEELHSKVKTVFAVPTHLLTSTDESCSQQDSLKINDLFTEDYTVSLSPRSLSRSTIKTPLLNKFRKYNTGRNTSK